MKKDLQEIESQLRDSRPADVDFSSTRYDIWQQMLKTRRNRRKPKSFIFLSSWVWTFASLILLGLGIILMIYLASL